MTAYRDIRSSSDVTQAARCYILLRVSGGDTSIAPDVAFPHYLYFDLMTYFSFRSHISLCSFLTASSKNMLVRLRKLNNVVIYIAYTVLDTFMFLGYKLVW